MRIRLSICIPTYNFGPFIGETLASIVPQLDDGVEIVVLDSGSTDSTDSVMAEWTARDPRIHYHKATEKGGIDRDMVRVTTFARGEYLWLFSADDLMRPTAFRELDTLFPSNSDVYLVSHSSCTLDMRVFRPVFPVLESETRRFAIADAAAREAYFARALTTEGFFSFMGGLVVRKSTWDLNADSDFFIGSCWAHAARLLQIMRDRGLSVHFIAAPLLDKRGDNDSFIGAGMIARYALAIEGYQAIAATLFGAESPEAFHVRRVLRREFGLGKFIYAKLACLRNPEREDRKRLEAMLASLYRDPGTGFVVRAGYRMVPAWMTVLAYRGWSWLKDFKAVART